MQVKAPDPTWVSEAPPPGAPDPRLAVAAWATFGLSLAGAVWVAASPLLRAIQVPGGQWYLLVAALASVGIALGLGPWARRSPTWSYLVSLVGLVVLLGSLSGGHFAEAARAVVKIPSDILSETLPLSGPEYYLGGPLVLTWSVGAASGEILGRSELGSRSRLAAGLAVPLLCFVATFAITSSASPDDAYSGPALLVLLGTSAASRRFLARWSEEAANVASAKTLATKNLRGALAAVAAVCAIAALAAAGVGRLPAMSGSRLALEHHVPAQPTLVVDPVDEMASIREADPGGPAHTLAVVSLDRPSDGYLGLAVLGRYDGAVWGLQGTFEPTGGHIPLSKGSPFAGVDDGRVTQSVTIEGHLPVPLLPALDRPVLVSGLAVDAEPTTGMLLPSRSAGPGTSYQVTSLSPEPTLDQLPAADGLAGPDNPDELALPNGSSPAIAAALRFLVGLGASRPAPTLAFLQSLDRTLVTQEKQVVPPATSSSSTAAATSTPSEAGTTLSEAVNAITQYRAATPEQFATLFAMAARYLGVPSRVVSGFRLVDGPLAGSLPAGTYQVTNRQAWTWVEIPVAGVGWVVVDPTPAATTSAPTPPAAQVKAPTTTLAPPQANAVPRSEVFGHALARRSKIDLPRHHSTPAWVLLLGALGALVLLVLAVGPAQVAIRRAWRRTLRRRGEPSEVVVGAWLDSLDFLAQAGLEVPQAATAQEVAALAASSLDERARPPLERVGRLAEQAIYSSIPVDREAASQAWADRAGLTVCMAGRPLSERLRASVRVGTNPRRPSAPARVGRGR